MISAIRVCNGKEQLLSIVNNKAHTQKNRLKKFFPGDFFLALVDNGCVNVQTACQILGSRLEMNVNILNTVYILGTIFF